MEENPIISLDGETADLNGNSSDGSMVNNNNKSNGKSILLSQAAGVVGGVVRKEDEKITTAVMKVLQGYQWSLVPTTTK